MFSECAKHLITLFLVMLTLREHFIDSFYQHYGNITFEYSQNILKHKKNNNNLNVLEKVSMKDV